MITYKTVRGTLPPTKSELNEQWKSGYELVSITGTPGNYASYFKYTGGNRAIRSVIGRGN